MENLKYTYKHNWARLSIWLLIGAAALFVTFQNYFLGLKSYGKFPLQYTHYNNFVIFRQSFFHLIHHKDLYRLFPLEYWDYYKYSPSFPLFMAPFAWLPVLGGLLAWNFLNAGIFALAVLQSHFLKEKQKLLLVLFCLIELITSMQNSQCNGLLAGLFILIFTSLERRKIVLATFLIASTVFIKIFGILFVLLFLLYPGKLKMVLYTAFWLIIFALLPLLVCSPSHLIFLYKSWLTLLQFDFSASLGLSVSGFLSSWFHFSPAKSAISLVGLLLLLLPYIFFKKYQFLAFRILCLASLLVWVIIFNHKAESPTFIIAVAGIGYWFFACKSRQIVDYILIGLAFIFTVLSPTDIFPRTFKEGFFLPYVLKAVPCIFIWLKIIWEQLFLINTVEEINEEYN